VRTRYTQYLPSRRIVPIRVGYRYVYSGGEGEGERGRMYAPFRNDCRVSHSLPYRALPPPPLGYVGLLSAVDVLSAQVRDAVMGGVLFQVNSNLALPLKAAFDIHHLTRERFPDIDTRTDISSQEGYLADLYYAGLQYPTLARLGYITSNNVYVAIQRASSVNSTFTSADSMQVTVTSITPGESIENTNQNVYIPMPIPSRNRIQNTAPFVFIPEMHTRDSASYIASYLGIPHFTAINFSISIFPWLTQVLASVNDAPTAITAGKSVEFLPAGWSLPFTAVDRSNSNGSSNFLSLAAFVPSVSAVTGIFTMSSVALFKLTSLEAALNNLPFGQHGICHVIRAGGDIMASSLPFVQGIIAETQIPYHMTTSSDELIKKVAYYLITWNLIYSDSVSFEFSTMDIIYTKSRFATSFNQNGYGWRIEAEMLDPSISGLPYTVVLLTRDDDFVGNINITVRNTAVAAMSICIAAVIASLLLTKCLVTPMMQVVNYMNHAVNVINMERGINQRKALAGLCEKWSGESGLIMPPLLPTSGGNGRETNEKQHTMTINENSSSSSSSDNTVEITPLTPHKVSPCLPSLQFIPQYYNCNCYRIGRNLREVRQMHIAFSSMLHTLASYDELESINIAKRQFIRYIFHEVRVPFNAVCMGIEHMLIEFENHSNTIPGITSALETLDILSDQSAIISRILNDVLSMQKIEDGALILNIDTFDIAKMIHGALYAFRTPCMEKRLKVRVNIQCLDEIISKYLPGLRVNKPRCEVTHEEEHPLANQHMHAAPRFSKDTNKGTYSEEEKPNSKKTIVDSHAHVRGDPYRLRQCLANFLSK
jgi:hypothetical protein